MVLPLQIYRILDRLLESIVETKNPPRIATKRILYNLLKKTKQRPYSPCLLEIHRKYVDFREENYLFEFKHSTLAFLLQIKNTLKAKYFR